MVGNWGRLYLPSASADGEKKKATCIQEFRIKGGCALQKLERKKTLQACAPVASLPLLE